jgi:hypothetical protein
MYKLFYMINPFYETDMFDFIFMQINVYIKPTWTRLKAAHKIVVWPKHQI